MKKLLVLEFNELSPVLMDRFIEGGHLPNFERLKTACQTYRTSTSDEELQPWVQWTTFHLGVPQSVHGIFSLDEGHLVAKDFLWDELYDGGIRTLVFGAMNGNCHRPGVRLMPDSWSSQIDASDEILNTLHSFSKLTVQEHTNPSKALSISDMAKYGLLFAKNGLRINTVFALGSQLIAERLRRRDSKWRRACLFDRLMWDVFRDCWTSSNAEAAVFFANSTAFLQHRYWRSLESEQFDVKPTAEDTESYGEAILAGYQNMDRMVGQILDDPQMSEASIVLATALSQHANPDRLQEAPHKAYRPNDFEEFLSWAGICDFQSVEPLMTHLAWATFPNRAAAEAAVVVLADTTVSGTQAFDFELHDNRVKFWCSVIEEIPVGVRMQNQVGDHVEFCDVMSIAASSLIDGAHHRDGILWIRNVSGAANEKAIEIPLENAKTLVVESVLVA